MDHRERRCGTCGHRNPPTAEFCSECAEYLDRVAEAGLARAPQTQFTLPDYLLAAREREREERRRRLMSESGDGVGLLWVGAAASLLALWFGGGVGIGAPFFALGLLLLLVGYWRLRGNPGALARAGAATTLFSIAVLAAVLVQTLGLAGGEAPAPPAESPATPAAQAVHAPAAPLARVGDVPMFRGDAARTGVNPGPVPLDRPALKWKSYVGGETYASPVVGLGAVYVATKSGSLIALGFADGKELWRTDIGDYIARGTPAFDGATLYVASGYTVVAIDARTGHQRWSEPLHFAGSCSPLVIGDRVLVATQEGHISALETATGKEIWHYRSNSLLFGSPAVANGMIVIPDETGDVTALDLETGRKRWQAKAGGEVFSTPAIADGSVYLATRKPSLVALELETGHKRWERGFGGESSPAIANGSVYLGSDDQAARAIDAGSGDLRWSTPLGYAIASSATVGDRAIFLASGPAINALDSRDGRLLWTYVTGGEISADLAVVANTVIASSHDGYVYALAPLGASADGSGVPQR
ncbi:MAG: PQQ-binding-like beta-propeller repeat protein [Thermomicrobiales bacterium]|nr:PQQ-binding-like beta-propeller repeat protein [Thermomicrobiales bacterium]